MNTQILGKFKDFYKNPIKLFGFITIILSLVLLFGCHFHLPDFYTNKELADKIAQAVAPKDVARLVKHLLNPRYTIYNCIFQIWALVVSLLIFCTCFKVNAFKRFKELTIFNKKLFAYLWINISYVIWGITYIIGNMIELEKFVYNGSADTMAIPLFGLICMITFIGSIYYPVMNILTYITFNTKIKRVFYSIIWGLAFIFWSMLFADCCFWKFTFLHLILDLYYFITLIFIIYAIGFIKHKTVETK